MAPAQPVARAVVHDRPQLSRFEVYVDGFTAGYAHYRMERTQLWLLRTVIEQECQAMNLEPVLMDGILRSVHRRRVEIVPFCPLLRAYVSSHPQYFHLIPQAGRPSATIAAATIAAQRKRRRTVAA